MQHPTMGAGGGATPPGRYQEGEQSWWAMSLGQPSCGGATAAGAPGGMSAPWNQEGKWAAGTTGLQANLQQALMKLSGGTPCTGSGSGGEQGPGFEPMGQPGWGGGNSAMAPGSMGAPWNQPGERVPCGSGWQGSCQLPMTTGTGAPGSAASQETGAQPLGAGTAPTAAPLPEDFSFKPDGYREFSYDQAKESFYKELAKAGIIVAGYGPSPNFRECGHSPAPAARTLPPMRKGSANWYRNRDDGRVRVDGEGALEIRKMMMGIFQPLATAKRSSEVGTVAQGGKRQKL